MTVPCGSRCGLRRARSVVVSAAAAGVKRSQQITYGGRPAAELIGAGLRLVRAHAISAGWVEARQSGVTWRALHFCGAWRRCVVYRTDTIGKSA